MRLGRTAAGETLQQGRWRSSLAIQRLAGNISTWELADRMELGGASLDSPHGLGGAPVFGTLVWAAPMAMGAETTATLLEGARRDREGLTGTMRCGALNQGLIARYSGNSSRDARFWFSRIWERTRTIRRLTRPRIPQGLAPAGTASAPTNVHTERFRGCSGDTLKKTELRHASQSPGKRQAPDRDRGTAC